MNTKKTLFYVLIPALIVCAAVFCLNRYSFSLGRSNKDLSDKNLLENIISLVNNSKKPKTLREALIVRLANESDITMYGRQINDTLSDKDLPGRRKYELHPYGKAGVCASALVTYQDEKDGEVYILLGKKHANPVDRSQGLAEQFIIFGGYMKPHHLEGAILDVENISDEEKDMAEEAILLKKKGYDKINNDPKHTNKDQDKKQGMSLEAYDVNLMATAIRELYEEAGLMWNSQNNPVQIGIRSTYGMTGDKRLHIVVADYLFDYGKITTPPITNPGSDIAKVVWVKLKDIYKNYSMSPQGSSSKMSRYSVLIDGVKVPILDSFGEVIDQYATLINMKLRIETPIKTIKNGSVMGLP